METTKALEQLLVQIIEELQGEKLDKHQLAALRDILENNGLDRDEHVPDWFTTLWSRILLGQAVEKSYFPLRELFGGEVDIVNFLAELSDLIDMEYENYGEGIEMNIEQLNAQVFISLEGKGDNGFYHLAPIDS